MISIRRISDAPIHGISQDGTAADIWNINPEMVISSSYDFIIEGKVRDSRFNKAGVILWIDIKDLVHSPTEVEHNSSPYSRSRTPVSH